MDLDSDILEMLDLDDGMLDKVLKYTEVLDKLNSSKKNIPYRNKEDKDLSDDRYNELNTLIDNRHNEYGLSNIYKVVPYVCPKYKKTFVILLKIIEIEILLSILDEYEPRETNGMNSDILNLLHYNAPDDKKQKIEKYLETMNLVEVISSIKGV